MHIKCMQVILARRLAASSSSSPPFPHSVPTVEPHSLQEALKGRQDSARYSCDIRRAADTKGTSRSLTLDIKWDDAASTLTNLISCCHL